MISQSARLIYSMDPNSFYNTLCDMSDELVYCRRFSHALLVPRATIRESGSWINDNIKNACRTGPSDFICVDGDWNYQTLYFEDEQDAFLYKMSWL
jgi:hypothetical protein